jgi:hypothetical protein
MSLGSVEIARNEAAEGLPSDEESTQRFFPGTAEIGSVATHHSSSTLRKRSSEHVGMAWVVLAI